MKQILHFHHTDMPLLTVTISGLMEFFVGCHSFASSGESEAKSLNPGITDFPAQYGQPVLS